MWRKKCWRCCRDNKKRIASFAAKALPVTGGAFAFHQETKLGATGSAEATPVKPHTPCIPSIYCSRGQATFAKKLPVPAGEVLVPHILNQPPACSDGRIHGWFGLLPCGLMGIAPIVYL
jgi:hypothetical protein